MARTGPIQVRVPEERRAAWEEAAAERGVPLSTLIRVAVEREIDVGPAIKKRSRQITTADVVRCPKASLHKKGQRCGYCGQTP